MVEGSVLQYNHACDGDGIENVGVLTLRNSTVSHNLATGTCDIYGEGEGGGIRNRVQSEVDVSGFLTITHSTITNSDAADADRGEGILSSSIEPLLGNTIVVSNGEPIKYLVGNGFGRRIHKPRLQFDW